MTVIRDGGWRILKVQVNLKSSAMSSSLLSIGELAQRAGVAASALRFYEEQGLIRGSRSGGGHRQYPREMLRRVAFIRAGQRVGLSLEELRTALATLPEGRTPTKMDWERLARGWQALLDERLAQLQRLRDQLSGCIGCGCLSLEGLRALQPRGRGGGARPRRPPAGAWRGAHAWGLSRLWAVAKGPTAGRRLPAAPRPKAGMLT